MNLFFLTGLAIAAAGIYFNNQATLLAGLGLTALLFLVFNTGKPARRDAKQANPAKQEQAETEHVLIQYEPPKRKVLAMIGDVLANLKEQAPGARETEELKYMPTKPNPLSGVLDKQFTGLPVRMSKLTAIREQEARKEAQEKAIKKMAKKLAKEFEKE